MSGPISAALRHEPTLRQANHAITIDMATAEARSTLMGKDVYMQHLREQSANGMARFFLNENLISFSEKKYNSELVLFGSMWTVSPDSPNLSGRTSDMEDARLRGRAEAAREILDAFQDHSQFPQTYSHWATKAHDIIGSVEDKFSG